MLQQPFKVMIDGECPLCKREGRLLAWLDQGRNRLVIEDITAAGFDPTGIGVSTEELMGQIRGVLPGRSAQVIPQCREGVSRTNPEHECD